MAISLPVSLDDGLILRAVETDRDMEKVVAINAEIHGAAEGQIVRRWLCEAHPTITRGDWLFVEDPSTGQAVATLSLIPMLWRYGGCRLPVAELGFVSTRPAYRRRGLQRVLSDAFDRLALARGYTLAAIEGIPGFYGQFGYAYAVPLEGGFDLAAGQIPDAAQDAAYVVRPARLTDVPDLQRLYDASIAALDLAALRDAALWTYQLSVPPTFTFYGHTSVLEVGDKVVGYLRWGDDEWSNQLKVFELAVDDGPGARERVLAALRFAADRAHADDKDGVRLRLPAQHPAVTVARYLGAVDQGHYAWQMRALDPPGFMQAIGPALEERLAASVLAGYSGTLLFDLYRSRLALRFEAGRLVEVHEPDGEADHQPQVYARMQRQQAMQLWLGWRGREALEAWYPDFSSQEAAHHLLDVLFPRARAYIYTPC